MSPRSPALAGLLSLPQAARVCGLSEGAVARGLRCGELRGEKVAGRWVIAAAELEAWLAFREIHRGAIEPRARPLRPPRPPARREPPTHRLDPRRGR